MIKLAIKHFILETCINTLFDSIDCNFKDYSFKVGDRIPILHVQTGNKKMYVRYHDVVIRSVNNPVYTFPSIHIHYKYEYIGKDVHKSDYIGKYNTEINYNGTTYFCELLNYPSDNIIWTDGSSTISTT
jgi:hypothetical protein